MTNPGTIETIERNPVLTELTASELRREADALLRCPERDYVVRGEKLSDALEALGWVTCRECHGEFAERAMDGVPLCESCLEDVGHQAYAGVLDDVLRELGPAGRMRLRFVIENREKYDLEGAWEMLANHLDLAFDPEPAEGEFPRPRTTRLG